MQQSSAIAFNVKWNTKTIGAFITLMVLPNLLGVINITTPWGFKVHLFQLGIFGAAALYGPIGGVLSGFLGSIYSASVMGNAYIIVGNVILGFFVGFFLRKGIHTILAVGLAYAIQLPWLIFSDYYLAHLSWPFIQGLVIALFISNIVWAVLLHYTTSPIKKFIQA
jgi:uncharacterized membrane protein